MRLLIAAIIAIFSALTTEVFAQNDEIVYFPDPYLKSLLVTMQDYFQPLIDLNYDGEIQYSEAAAYKDWLYLGFRSDSITDLTGIKAFINAPSIHLTNCSGIREIDISGMVNLNEVYFDGNKNLTYLNVSGCINLESIDCNESQLQKLNAENCKRLSHLWCSDNSLLNINIAKCIGLRTLVCENNKLSNINIDDCYELDGIVCYNNVLTDLDVSHLTKLTGISCNNNLIKTINVSSSHNFIRLRAFNNQLESINIRNGNNKNVTIFQTYGNPNLKCITVDDTTYSKDNWKEIDEWTEFSEDCSSSVNDNPQNLFSVYPNPASNSITIEREGIEQADLRILDITGRIFISYTIPYGVKHIQLDTSRLSIGNYIIEINNETKSLIIE